MQGSVRDFWQDRAEEFTGSLRVVLDWVRDVKGVTPTPDDPLEVASLRGVASIVRQRRLSLEHSDRPYSIDLDDMPDALVAPLERYLGEIAGYDPSVSIDEQRSQEPGKQHGYVLYEARRLLPGILA